MNDYKIVTKKIQGQEVEVKVYDLKARSDTYITAHMLGKKSLKDRKIIFSMTGNKG